MCLCSAVSIVSASALISHIINVVESNSKYFSRLQHNFNETHLMIPIILGAIALGTAAIGAMKGIALRGRSRTYSREEESGNRTINDILL
jgi:hypothetical protein